MENLGPGEQTAVDDFVAAVESKWEINFLPGYDPSLRFMAHVWEPLRVQHKPLIMYAMTELAARIAHLLLQWMGFKRGHQGAFTSWTSPPLQYSHEKGTAEKAGSGTGGTTHQQDGTANARNVLPLGSHDGVATSTPSSSGTPRAGSSSHVREAAHNAVEQALDAAVVATSAAAATMTKQYPHEGQQYHLPPPRGGFPAYPIITTFREISGFLERRVALPETSPPRRRRGHVRSGSNRLRTRDSANSVGFDAELHRNTSTNSEVEEERTTEHSISGANHDNSGSSSFARPKEDDTTHSSSNLEEQASTVPVVFLHGVGFGTLPYLFFVRSMMKACPKSPFILLEMPHVALRLCKEAESVDDVAAASVAVVQQLGVRQACFVGHSYGTFCVSRIVQLFPEAVHSTALLDPVCMLTCYPQLLFNFIYRTISSSALTSVVAAIDGVRFLCSRDLTISQAFCRRFHWSELMLWPEDLPRKRHHSLIVLSGKDDLVPGVLVQAQFEAAEHPATVMYHPELGHGGLLLSDSWMTEVVAGVKRLVHRKEENEGDAGVRQRETGAEGGSVEAAEAP